MLNDPPDGSKEVLAAPKRNSNHIEIEHCTHRDIQPRKPQCGKAVDIRLIKTCLADKADQVKT